ncbi:MAG: 50S ribosomal protein L29 [Betaproteobacteria bacterium TMED41]|nr:MAG: 50S ribosomal protein L29 [Betaproteobacteria bacterium TMED41]|tara:strand:+ start:325 stop:543 length:219 start_codon:yes stop_codon:yes gene_type:complete
MKFSELKDKNIFDLEKELESLSKAQFSLRMQYGTQQLTNTSQLRQTKRNIARVKTVIRQKELETTKTHGKES